MRQRSRQPPPGGGAQNSALENSPPTDEVTTSPAAGEAARSEIGGVHQAIQAAEEGLALVSAARHGLESVQHRLGRMAAVLRAAFERAGPGAPDAADWAEALRTVQSDADAIDRIAAETRCGGTLLLDGSFGCKAAAYGPWLELVSVPASVRSSPPGGYAVALTQEPTRATVLGEQPLTAERIAAGESLALEAEGRQICVVTRAGQTAPDVVAEVRTALGAAGLPLVIALTEGERLLVYHLRYGSKWGFRVRSRTPGLLSTRAGLPRIGGNGRDVAGTLHGEPAVGEGQVLAGLPGNRYTAGLAVRYKGTPPPGFEAPRERGRGTGPAPRDGWKDGTLAAGRVLVVQRALVLRVDAAEPQELRLDSVACADLGAELGSVDGCASVAEALQALPQRCEDALSALERARAAVGRSLAAALRLEREVLGAHLARLRTEAENLLASHGAADPRDAGDWVAQLGEQLRRVGTGALTVQRYPRPTVMMRLLGSEGGEESGCW
jgi:hypothetical protein